MKHPVREIKKPDEALAKILLPASLPEGVFCVPSRFTLSFAHKGRNYVYNTLTRQCLEAELPERCRAGEGCDELIGNLFLVPEDKDECGFYNDLSSLLRKYARIRSGGGYQGFTIMPSLACNASCIYCYEEGMKPVTMTPETADRTIRFILETGSDKGVTLRWFGGEPLLRPDLIGRICEGLRDSGRSYHSVMVSNGSLITEEILSKMKGLWRLTRIQISMDGAESDYILRKRYGSYEDQYQRVLGAVRAVSEAGIQVLVRCNVDCENIDSFPLFLKDLKKSVPCREGVKLYLSPLYQVRAGQEDLRIWEKVADAGPMIEAAGFSSFYSSPSGKKKPYRASRCMADGNGVVIGPDGSLYACEHCPPESRLGDIWRGVTGDEAGKEFCRSDRTRVKCRTCPFLPDCTSFASCPVEDSQCREVRTMLKTAWLRHLIDNADKNYAAAEELPSC